MTRIAPPAGGTVADQTVHGVYGGVGDKLTGPSGGTLVHAVVLDYRPHRALANAFSLLLVRESAIVDILVVPIVPPTSANPGSFYDVRRSAVFRMTATAHVVKSTGSIGDLIVILVGVHDPAQRQGLEITLTYDPLALLPDSVQCRHQNRHQNRDNGDHHQKLDQCKTSSLSHNETPSLYSNS